MVIVKRISPGSAFKVALVVYGIWGLAAAVFCGASALTGVQFSPHAHYSRSIGLVAVILCPILWGTIAGIVGAISALIYNLAATGWGDLSWT